MFSERLKLLRAAHHVSQSALGKDLFVSKQAVAKWELGTASPNPEMIAKIAKYFDVSTDYLLGRTDEAKPASNIRVDGHVFQIRLKELREATGLSQYSFAKQFGVAQSTVGSWEAGKREPNFATAQRLADFFNVSVDYLLGRTDEKSPAPGEAQNGEKKNVVRTIGRDGSYEERYLTDEQLEALKAVIRQMPKVEDDF